MLHSEYNNAFQFKISIILQHKQMALWSRDSNQSVRLVCNRYEYSICNRLTSRLNTGKQKM